MLAAVFAASLSAATIADAHPGRTDAKGGHTCRTNCEKWGLEYGEYHYHNGGGSSSDSSSSSSSDSGSSSSSTGTSSGTAGSASVPKETVPPGTVQVSLPAYSVYVNGEQIMSQTGYPVFEYKGITYFPMTWSYTQALGLETAWSTETGFSIRSSSQPAAALEQEPGTPPAKLFAAQPDFNVFVNDSWVDNSKEEYPVLVLNDVTYFPMTWRYSVEELGLTTRFENNAFYISKETPAEAE
ncbi:YHYH domain-containing protein [Paenibacillus sp. y28]|uniref:YHYH domain-containing protein n=1 Tax=Paenibacillus sp. y28 TaxID=3129110 RepID=UPI003015D1CD